MMSQCKMELGMLGEASRHVWLEQVGKGEHGTCGQGRDRDRFLRPRTGHGWILPNHLRG